MGRITDLLGYVTKNVLKKDHDPLAFARDG